MSNKRRKNPYRLADIIIAAILGAVLGLTVSLMTDELLKPIVFYGDLTLAFMLAGVIVGVIGVKRSTDWLDDLLKQLRDYWRWTDGP